MVNELTVAPHRPPPTRGLVSLRNARGQRMPWADVLRWVRLCRQGYKLHKVDVLAADDALEDTVRLLDETRDMDIRLSLRTDTTAPPEHLARLHREGLWDLFLTPAYDAPLLQSWLDAARELELPVRVQFQGRIPDSVEPERMAAALAEARVRVVHVAVHDPFAATDDYKSARQSAAGVAAMVALATACATRGIESNLVRLPFCQVPNDLWPHVVNTPQFFRDHQQYDRDAYVLATKLYTKHPAMAGTIVQMLLGRHTSYANPIDSKLLPWLLDAPWLRARVWAWHKVSRHRRWLGLGPAADAREDEQVPAGDRVVAGPQERVCANCSMIHLCDHYTHGVARVLPGLELEAQPGDAYRWPLLYAEPQPKYYDGIDAGRAGIDPGAEALAREAAAIVTDTPPKREISSFDYGTEGQWSHQVQGGVRWHSYTNTEKTSTPLGSFTLPFTLSVTFGGGIAETIGFSVGRLARIMCPMTAYHHTLVLHVAADGRYVLLRDGHAIRPLDLAGGRYVPTRLGDRVELRLALDNIDGTLVTQAVQVWEPATENEPEKSVDYSIVIVSARYARRLQAVLQSLVHQEAFDLSRLEVIVAYVPGIDSNEDVMDTIASIHPELRIVRVPYVEEVTRSKGFLINETCKRARGEWIILLDSDILVPPDLFRTMDALPDDAMFAAPNGRKMLTPETTARILLGDVRPWEQWQELLKEAGEFRYREVDGVPIGYFQALRRQCLEKVQYEEYEHFEGADWGFGKAMRDVYGPEIRLSGHPVLHLDHGGSKWYGTRKHF